VIDQREIDFVLGVSNALMRSITTPSHEIAFSLKLEQDDAADAYLDIIRKVGKTYGAKLICDYDPEEDLIDVYIKEATNVITTETEYS
jgi:hypothetical protein